MSITEEEMNAAATGDEPESLDAFRVRVRTFLDAHVPRRSVVPDDEGVVVGGVHDSSEELVAKVRAYQSALFDARLAGLTWPVEYGGQGLGAVYQQAFNEIASQYEVSSRIVGIGLGMCGPAILAHGSEEQRQRYLPPLLRGDEIWCQLFSEPAAGSDIAAVRTRIRRTDDGWVVDGQKVWSSVAHHATFGLLLGRTDPDVPKHDGLSMLIIPMDAPGVEVRPLRQMDGGANFNEVFLTDVRVGPEALVGEVDGGWAVARTTLSNERGAVSGGRQGNSSVVVPLVRLAQQLGGIRESCLRADLVRLYETDLVLQELQARARRAREAGLPPGPEGSVAKLLNARVQKGAADIRMRLVGMRSVAWEDDDIVASAAADAYLASPAASIGGGTDQIQKSIVGERILGLDREPSADKGIAFRKLTSNTQ